MLLKKSNLKPVKLNQFVFDAIGTKWVIDFEGSPAFADVQKFIDSFDREYSRFRSDSKVTKIANTSGNYSFSDPEMLTYYENLYQATNGLVTPLIGQVMEESGYDSSYSLTPKNLNKPPKWEEVLSWNPPILKVKKPVLLDFGAAGKGRLVDLIGAKLEKFGSSKFSVDGGGDILVKNLKLKIGLEHPGNPSLAIGIAELENGSICASSGNRRKWRNFHHIINPDSLKPVNSVLAVWTVSKTAMEADGLATALFFVEPEVLSDFAFDYLIVYPDYTFKKSPSFPGEVYETRRQLPQ